MGPLVSSGIADMAYIPSPNTTLQSHQWPNLGDLILAGKRIILFMDHMANKTQAPYILDEFVYMWQTPFATLDGNFTCTIDQPGNLTDDREKLYIANHYLNTVIYEYGVDVLIADKANLSRSNAASGGYGTLGLAAEQCIGIFPPNLSPLVL